MKRKDSKRRGLRRKTDELTPAAERFCAECGRNGKHGQEAALIAYPGQSPDSAKVTACRLMRQDAVRARIAEHIKAQTECTPEEVIGTLVAQMRFDPLDFLVEGTLDLDLMKNLHAGGQIKELKIHSVTEVNGTKKKLITEVVSCKFHSQQMAAFKLCNIFGLERVPTDDAQIRHRIQRAVDRIAQKYYDGDVERAKATYIASVPEHTKYLM